MTYKTYELRVTRNNSTEYVEMDASSAAKAIRYYADRTESNVDTLTTTEADQKHTDVFVSDKNVCLEFAKATLSNDHDGIVLVSATIEVEDRRDYER